MGIVVRPWWARERGGFVRCTSCGTSERVEEGSAPPSLCPTCSATEAPEGYPPPLQKEWPWEVTVDTSGKALERLARGLLVTRGRLTSVLPPSAGLPWGRGVSATVMVVLDEGTEGAFRGHVRPTDMRAPSRLQVGTRIYDPSPGHPGRE